MGATSRTYMLFGILFLTIQLISFTTAQEEDKRGPQGFLGMRGKKFESIDQFYKRKPQFFVGVKGKRDYYDIMDTPDMVYYKRAPIGFMGMRGKKDNPDEIYPDSYEYVPKRGSLIGQIDYTSNDNNNEFPILNELLKEYLNKLGHPNSTPQSESNESGEDERINNEIAKRAASIHQFFGVRGKKSINNKRLADVSFRGKFIGVRGKKDLKNSEAQEITFLPYGNGPLPKRKGQMGFIGMRGKKWNDESSPELNSLN